jgi:hypothetical protein
LKYTLPQAHHVRRLGRPDILCIYIRSGDIFSTAIHPAYVQPPYWFYEQIIRSRYWIGIYLITENQSNPVVVELLRRYPRMVWQVRTLDEDLGYLLTAANLVGAYGTFLPAILDMREQLPSRYWLADYQPPSKPLIPSHPEITTVIPCPGYTRVGKWRNTPAQRELMLSYRP